MKKLKYLIIFCVVTVSIYFIYNIKSNDANDNNITSDIVVNKDNIVSSNNSNESDKKVEEDAFEPVFSYTSIPDDIRDKMIGVSMPENKPISFDTLSYLNLTYYGFDDKIHIGEMVVNNEVAAEVVDIFKELYDKKFPIEKIKLIDEYNAIDEDSMANNNSSSFCYRTIAGTNQISNHGKGLAIDINPLQNPHVKGDEVSPSEGYMYKDRATYQKGMITKGDDLYNAFVNRGWSWGGNWTNPDYQHFEKNL
ncbi:M15 family metallopeptidase [Romboutsia sp.]|uniref:M15 family metallopeptidase n=1 Tax=Romboutsia sp. TaxID=1965302 RepID=UPI003F2D3F46